MKRSPEPLPPSGAPGPAAFCCSIARANKRKVDWRIYAPPVPTFFGVRSSTTNYDLPSLSLYRLDAVLFRTLGAGRAISVRSLRMQIRQGCTRAVRRRAEDAAAYRGRKMADRARRLRLLPRLTPATTTLWFRSNKARKFPDRKLHTLRQQMTREGGRPNLALADFVAPAGTPDYIRRLRGHRRPRRRKTHQALRGRA